MARSFADWETMIRSVVQTYCETNDDFARVLANDNSPTDYLPRAGAHGGELVRSFDDRYKGELAAWLYYRHRLGLCAQSIYREALNAAWCHNHIAVLAYVRRNRLLLKAMFRHAAFPVPAELPDRIDVWRGSGGKAPNIDGLSWTTDRDVACWFACNWGDNRGRGDRAPKSPLVLKLTVPKADLAFLFNGRNESEVIYFPTPGSATPDGDPIDWIEGASRRSSRALISA
jgi:hypothetical protein